MPNPFDEITKSSLAKQAYGPVFSSQYADAMKSGRANETARRLGIDPDIVEADMPNMLAEDRLRKRIAETHAIPAYARIMANRRLAAAAIDDDELPKVAERTQGHVEAAKQGALGSSYLSQMGSAIRNRFGALEGGFSRMMAANTGNAGYLRTAREGEALAAGPQGDKLTTWEQVKGNWLLAPKFGAEQIVTSAPDMLMTLNPLLLTAYVAARSGEIGQQRAVADGRTEADAKDVAIAAPFAAASAFLERIGVKGIGSGIKNATTRAVFQAGSKEAFTEYFQSGVEYLGGQAGTKQGANAEEMFDQMEAGAVGGFFGGGGMAGTGAVVHKVAQQRRDVQLAGGVNRIMEAAAASQTRSNNPSDFREALNQLVGNTEAADLYVPVQAIVDSVGESDQPISEHPVWGPYAEQIAEAQALGGDVVLPLADAATDLAGSPTWEAIRDHVRTRPGGVSIAEAKNKASPEELQAMTERVANDIVQATGHVQMVKARKVVGRFAENIVSEGPQAATVNRMLTSWLVTRFNADSAKRAAKGEAPITIEQFGEANLPEAKRMLQAQFEAGGSALGDVAPEPAPTAPVQRVARPAAAKPRKAQTVIAFIRANGGIKNNEGHDLSKGRGLSRHPGLINNKSGSSIDDIGEKLYEAGFFGGTLGNDRPTTAQVLEMLDEADTRRIVRPEDALDDVMAQRDEQADGEEAAARAEIEQVIAETGMTFSAEEVESMMVYRGSGLSAHEAIERVMADINVQLADELDGESETGYDYKDAADDAFDATFYQNGGGTASRSQGQDGQQAATGASEGGAGQPDGLEQAWPGDLRYWLQAQTEGRLKGTKEQKAPGSDGGLFDTRDTQTTLFQTVGGAAQTETPAFKAWSKGAELVSVDDAEERDFKTGEAVVVEAFHGTKRPDRIGNRFRKKRATSGPMAFHTSNPALASGYAEGKDDTSLYNEDTSFESWFKYKPKGQRTATNIDRAWHQLDRETQDRIFALAPRVTFSEDGEHIILGPEDLKSGNGGYDHALKETQRGYDRRGNPLAALLDAWVMSGSIFDEEERFMQVLKLAGMPTADVTFDSPNASYPFVYKNYIAMQSPLVTSDIPAEVVDALANAARKDRSRSKPGADLWDKGSRTVKEWWAYFQESPEHAWTSIPDKITDVLKTFGFDGIVDWSGKNGGERSPVYIPFEENQVKSAIGNRGSFDNSSIILNQTATPEDRAAFLDAVRAPDLVGTVADDAPTLGQQKRGNISFSHDEFGMMEHALIRAFESANFSTAVHELGHFFLEDLRRRALASDATEQELADWATFKQWCAPLGHTISDGGPIPVGAHEYFARGFERYTFEGKAPVPALRGLFFQMREFMKKLYTRASQFDAPITPEIREVMGRMIASDAEVAEQAREMKLAAGKIDELMTEDERRILADLTDEAREDARDQVLERALSTLRQEKTAEVRARKDEIRQEVSADVDSQPVFRALKLLKVGIPQTDGSFIKVRLGRQQLLDAYGEGVLDTLPKLVPEIHSDKDGQDIDTVAGLSGFDSGDALVKALQGHAQVQAEMKEGGDKRSPRARMIDEAVEDRVRDEIGDPFEHLEEEAQAALANERRADAISLELRAIARKTGKKPTPWNLAKEFAAKYVLKATSAEAISGKAVQMYNRNATKAGQEAVEAIIKGDMEAAFAAKQRQLLNLALLSEAKIAKEKVDVAQRRLKKIASRQTIPSVDQDYLEQAQALLEDVAMGDESRPAIERRKSFEDWYLQQVAEGKDPVVPKEYARLLGKGNWRDLSIESFLELDNAVGQIIALGRLKQTLRDGSEMRDFNEAMVELTERLNAEVEGRKVGNENDPSRSFLGTLKSRIRSADSWMVTARSLVSWFDGNDSTGPWHRLLLNPFGEAQGRADDLMREYGERMNEMIAALPKAQLKALKRKVDTPELINRIRDHPGAGEPFVFHMDQILVMALNWGNEGNRQRLLDGFGWQESQVEAVFDRLMTKELWDFVSQTWEVVNRLWPDLAEMERRVNGVAPEKIEGTTVDTRFGTYQGGYFPIVYDSQYSARVELDEAAKLSPGGGMQQVAVRSGASHNRVEAVKGRPLLLSIGLVTNHMTEVVHDITHREAVHQAKRILTDDRIRTAIITKFGKEYHEALTTWLKSIAHPGAAFAEASRAEVSFGRHMTTGMSVVGLGLRVTTILVQPLGLLNVASRVGGKHLLMEGVWTAMRHPLATYNEVTAKSAMMRARYSNIDTSMADIIANKGNVLEKMGMGNILSASGAFRPIAFMDSLVTTAGWIAAYNQGLQGKAHGSGPMSEEEAIAYADDVIISTQGGGGMMDRSAMMNAHPLVRMLYPFFTFANAMFNQQRDAVRLMGKEGSRLEGARRAWWVFIVPVLVQALLFGDGPDAGDDDETTAEDWLRYLAGALMVGNTYSLPLVGPIVNAWGNGYGYRSSALQGVGEDTVKAGKDVVALATDEDAELSGQTVKKLFGIAGITFHKALGQVGTTAGGALEYAKGNENPEDIGDWYELLAKGRTSKGPTSAEQLAGE